MIILANGEAGPPADAEDLLRRSRTSAAAGRCRWPATPRAPPRSSGSRCRARRPSTTPTGAPAVATSQLCKCSWYGCDPYWGRVASDLGSAGIDFDPDRLSVAYGGVTVALDGVAAPHDVDAVAEHMAGATSRSRPTSASGTGTHVITNDLTHAYIDENMGTS